jgi:hypothetical protein
MSVMGLALIQCNHHVKKRQYTVGYEVQIVSKSVETENIVAVFRIRIRIDFALLYSDQYWECGSGYKSRSKEIEKI